ncbi:lysozyme inhibitor LprI family protein [Pseudomonas sp. NPDC089534]|uniref:lysozyme inhibitor LprI family protein n=1 Tax=Pseudomonas sp. NPDC089534 TaxID=3364468 RepID=UPI003826A03E
MRKFFLHIKIIFCSLVAFSSLVHSASFDCSKASSDVEIKICSTPSLSKLDEQLSEVFKPLKKQRTFQVLESEWLENVRNTCESVECLEDAYNEQIGFLSPLPLPGASASNEVKILPADKVYAQSSRPWKTVELAGLPNGKDVVERFLISAEVISGMLHVVAFEGHFDVPNSIYRGGLYEYIDRHPIVQPITYTIAKDIGFQGAFNLGNNEEGERYAGIMGGTFYYREKIARNQLRGMAYKVGSGTQPQETSLLLQQWSNTFENAKSGLLFQGDEVFGELKAYYPNTPGYETIAPVDRPEVGWNIFSPIWSKSRPVLYFKNGDETIWRADVVDKTLTKIVSASDQLVIKNPTPVDLNGREAIVYLEDYILKIAVAPE